MSRLDEFYRWRDEIKRRLLLSVPFATEVALWSAGIMLSGLCSLTEVALALEHFVGRSLNTLRQRMRELYKEANHKSGDKDKRRTFDVEACFGHLLAWIAAIWQGDYLTLALDATTIQDRFTLLCISVTCRGMAIPVAWRVLKGNEKEAWQPHWCDMLDGLRGVIGTDKCVLVMTDRGLYAKWLFDKIVSLSWHPMMRIKDRSFFTPEGADAGAAQPQPQRVANLVPAPGEGSYKASGVAFLGRNQLCCTLVASQEVSHEPLAVLTDLPANQCEPQWYSTRFWIERLFKTQKSAALQLQRTRITDPARLQRLLLPIAMSILYSLGTGGQIEDEIGSADTNIAKDQRQRPSGTKGRQVSLFRRSRYVVISILMGLRKYTEIVLKPEPLPGRCAYQNTS